MPVDCRMIGSSGVRLLLLGFCAGILAGLQGCSPAIRYSSTLPDTDASVKHSIPPNEGSFSRGGTVPYDRLKSILDSYLGTPYRYGGMSRRGIDCSGLVFLVYQELAHTSLPRNARSLYAMGRHVPASAMKPGDLVFFRTGLFRSVNHVGIAAERGRFVHASSRKGVMYSSLDEEYFRKHFVGIRRIF